MRVLGITGSLRRESYNHALLREAAERRIVVAGAPPPTRRSPSVYVASSVDASVTFTLPPLFFSSSCAHGRNS